LAKTIARRMRSAYNERFLFLYHSREFGGINGIMVRHSAFSPKIGENNRTANAFSV